VHIKYANVCKIKSQKESYYNFSSGFEEFKVTTKIEEHIYNCEDCFGKNTNELEFIILLFYF